MITRDTNIFNAYEKEIRPDEELLSALGGFSSEQFEKCLYIMKRIFSELFDVVVSGGDFRMVINYDAKARHAYYSVFKDIKEPVSDNKNQED